MAQTWNEYDQALAQREGKLTVVLAKDSNWPDFQKIKILLRSYLG